MHFWCVWHLPLDWKPSSYSAKVLSKKSTGFPTCLRRNITTGPEQTLISSWSPKSTDLYFWYFSGTLLDGGNFFYCPPKNKKWAVNFVISFVEIFALIFTQTAWKRMYIAPPTTPPPPTPPTCHPPVRMIMLYKINDNLSFILCDFVTLNKP